MLKHEAIEVVKTFAERLAVSFGVSGAVTTKGSQPGALEVVADALSQGNFSNGVGVGSGLVLIAKSIDKLSDATLALAEAVRRQG